MWAERRLAVFFACLGLVPFFAGALGVWLLPAQAPLIAEAFFLFSAGVLAFMAGVYWPISMQLDRCAYPVSPMTAILLSQAFFALAGVGLLIATRYQALWYAVAYGLLYVADLKLLKGFWPDWYMRLRLLLTLAVVGTQLLAGYALWA